jgi:DNA-binding PadR family transcriptional regulator
MKDQTLSNIAITVLALVSEKPMGAYDMVGIMEKANFERWLPASSSSIYTMAKTLEKRSLIKGTQVKEGNMPEKTVYAITAAGKTALEENLGRCLESEDAHNAGFDIGMLFMCHLRKESVMPLLQRRISRLKTDLGINAQHLQAAERNAAMPFIGPMLISHNRLLKEAELRLTIELISRIERTDAWHHFIAIEP